MAHPDLLAGPALRLRAGPRCLAEQGPLRSEGGTLGIPEVGGHVPPFDAVVRMRAMVRRKRKSLAGNDRREPFGVLAKPGKALRGSRLAAEPKGQRAAGKGAAGYFKTIAHRRKS